MRRALIMASGANRGAYYGGFMKAFQANGIEFDLHAGVSAGGISSAWMAAGDFDAYEDSWRQADPYRIAIHPFLARGKTRTVDQLIQSITLKTMDVEAARTSKTEVRVATAKICGMGRLFSPMTREDFSNRDAKNAEHFGRMLRATAFVPVINGLSSAITIGSNRYLDGGLVCRIPLDLAPTESFDEIWVGACSPNGIAELVNQLKSWERPERLVILTPTQDLPVNRWSMEWAKIGKAIDLGAADMEKTIRASRNGGDHICVGMAADSLRQALNS